MHLCVHMDMEVDIYVYNNTNIYSILYIDDHIIYPSAYMLRIV